MYVSFKNPDNSSWYQLWITEGKTGLALHANYDKTGSTEPTGNAWWKTAYGRFNRPALSKEQAVTLFAEKIQKRLEHGYVVDQISVIVPEVP